MIEVMFAALLLGVVGTAIVGFLTTVASGPAARQHLSDPALESSLAVRRFGALAPHFRCVLTVTPGEALVWLSDLVPSRSVHTSEVGVLRFDESEGMLVLETVNPANLFANRKLEREFNSSQFIALATQLDELREDGALVRSVLAEGMESVDLAPVAGAPGTARLTFSVGGVSASVTIAPAVVEEPIE